MRCEVVAVGTELILGQIVDTNSSWIADQLAQVGVDSYFQTKVGDNAERIAATLQLALGRSEAVIVCGGLGPTQDDITRDVIAQVMGVELLTDPTIEARLREIFEQRGRRMPENNLRQAMVPVGATVMDQFPGTAPGLICPIGNKVIYAVPGVPSEMQEMVEGTVIPDLRGRAGSTSVIASRVLRTWGTSESGVAEVLADRIVELDETGSATIAFLASGIDGIRVRVTVKARTTAEAAEILDSEVTVVAGLLGSHVFSVDDETMEQVVVRLLRERGRTLGVAESVTGGMIAERLTAVPGASEVFRGGIVSYATDVKYSVLGVPKGPVVSAEAAIAMAEGVCRLLDCDVAVATTGVAGPTTQEGVDVGTVHMAVVVGGVGESAVMRFPGDRERIRQFATISVLDMLRRRLLRECGAHVDGSD